jgi:hypothetical protein
MTKVLTKALEQVERQSDFRRKLDFKSSIDINELVQRCLSFASFHESRCDWAKAYGFELLAMNEYLRFNGTNKCEKNIMKKFVETCRKHGLCKLREGSRLTTERFVDLLISFSESTFNQTLDTPGVFDSGIGFKALKIAVQLGSSVAAFQLGEFILNNRQANRINIQHVFHYFKLAADRGHVLSARYTAELYSSSNDVEKSLEYYAIAKNSGDAESAFRLGCFFINTIRYHEGCSFLQNAVELKHPEASRVLDDLNNTISRLKNSSTLDNGQLNTLLLIELKYPNNPYVLKKYIYHKLLNSQTLLDSEKKELEQFKPKKPTLGDLFKF